MPQKNEAVIPIDADTLKEIMAGVMQNTADRIFKDLLDYGNIPLIKPVKMSGTTGSASMGCSKKPVIFVTVSNFTTADIYICEDMTTDIINKIGIYGKIAAGTTGTIPVVNGQGKFNVVWSGAADPAATVKVIVSGHNLGAL